MAKKAFKDISDIDISSPQSVKALKEHVVKTAYEKAMSGDKDAVSALSTFISIVVEAERQYNVVREERLKELENIIDELEDKLDLIVTQNQTQESENNSSGDNDDDALALY